MKSMVAVRRSARCLSSCRTDFPRMPAPAGPAFHRVGASFLVRLEQCPWQASRTTKRRAAGQAAHCSVSTAEDKQRADRRTAAIRFMKSFAK